MTPVVTKAQRTSAEGPFNFEVQDLLLRSVYGDIDDLLD